MMSKFESLNWRQPVSLDEAHAFFLRFPDAVPMGGGQHLVPAWRHTGTPPVVVSLTHIPELRNIRRTNRTLKIGAAVTLQELVTSPTIQKTFPVLASMVGQMGDRLMRNRATMGGALCSTRQDGCIPAAMLGTGATLHTTACDIPAHDWFQLDGMSSTLQDGEFILGVSLKVPDVAAHQCLRLVPGRNALITVFASRHAGEFSVGISGLSDTAFRATAAEDWLASGKPFGNSELNTLFSAYPGRTDIHATSTYREAQARRLLKRVAETL